MYNAMEMWHRAFDAHQDAKLRHLAACRHRLPEWVVEQFWNKVVMSDMRLKFWSEVVTEELAPYESTGDEIHEAFMEEQWRNDPSMRRPRRLSK